MNVSCPACKTRYSVDDARVPPTGVTIKCPKCAHTFVAKRPEAAARAPSAVALPGSVAPGGGAPQAAPPAPSAAPRPPPPGRIGSAVALPGSVAGGGVPAPSAAPRPPAPSAAPRPPAPSAAPPPSMNIPAASTDAGLDDMDLGLDDLDSRPQMDGLGAPPAAPPPPQHQDAGVLDFIDDTADRARLKPSGPAQTEYKVRRRNGRVEGPYGVGRITAMLRNKELHGTEDISEDGMAWRAMTSDGQLNHVINEAYAAEEAMSFGNVDLGAGGGGDLDLGIEGNAPPPAAAPAAPANPHMPTVGPAPGGGRSASSIEDIMGDLDAAASDVAAADGLGSDVGMPPPMGGAPGGAPAGASLEQSDGLKIPGGEELEVGEIPELPPFWQTYKKPIIAFSVVVSVVLVGVLTHLLTPYGPFGIPALIEIATREPPPPPPAKPPPPPPKVADPKELAGLIDEHCYECFRSVFATIASAGPQLPDNMLALAKARGFATLAYGKEAFPTEDLVGAVEALNTIDLGQAMGGNAAAANIEILKARSALEIITGSADGAEPQLAAQLEQRPDDRELALLLGMARRTMKDNKGALEALDKALVTEPSYAPALHQIGEIVLELGGNESADQAAQWFEKALDVTPSHVRSAVAAAQLHEQLHRAGARRRALRKGAKHIDRGLAPKARAAYLHDTALAFEDVGRLDEVSDIAAEASRLEPANNAYVATAARAAAAKGSTMEALQLIEPVLKRDPKDVDALLARARIYITTEDIAKSFVDLEAAKASTPRDFNISLWEARFNIRLGKIADARKSLAISIKRAKNSAAPNVELGRLDLAVGDVDNAFKNAEEAVAKSPYSAHAHALLGDAFMRRGQLDRAKETYSTALALDDELISARIGYANSLRDTGAKERRPARSKSLAEAIPLYLAALEAEPKNPQVLFEYGRGLELQGDLPAALDLYKQAAALDEQDPRPHLKMVSAFLEQKDLAAAKKSLERARTIEMAGTSKSGEVRFWEARLAMAEGRTSDAVASLRGAVDLEPRNALYHYWLGRALEKNNSLYEAITYYEKAVQLNSRLAMALRSLGWTAIERNQYAKARGFFEKFIEAAPDDKSIYVDIGRTYERENRDDEAMKAFQKALRYLPNNGTAAVQMGNILSKKGKHDKAQEFFRRATRSEPNLGAAWCQLGISTAKRKLDAASRSALNRCMKLDNSPDDMKREAADLLGL